MLEQWDAQIRSWRHHIWRWSYWSTRRNTRWSIEKREVGEREQERRGKDEMEKAWTQSR